MALGADWPGRRFLLSWPFSRRLERSSDLLGHRLCRAERGRQRGLVGQVGHSSKVSLVLLRHEPEMEVRCSLHQGQEVGALDSGGRLDRRNEPMEDGAELGALGWRISPKSNRWRLASTMTVPALDDFSGACSTRKYSPSTIEPAGRGPSRSADPRLQAVLLPADVRLGRSAPQEREEGGEELLGHLEIGDVPALGHHDP